MGTTITHTHHVLWRLLYWVKMLIHILLFQHTETLLAKTWHRIVQASRLACRKGVSHLAVLPYLPSHFSSFPPPSHSLPPPPSSYSPLPSDSLPLPSNPLPPLPTSILLPLFSSQADAYMDAVRKPLFELLPQLEETRKTVSNTVMRTVSRGHE